MSSSRFTRLSSTLILAFACAALSLAVFSASSALAAMPLTLVNNSGYKVAFCLNYKSTDGSWLTHGWWAVDPRSSRKISVATNNGIIYYYARDHAGSGYHWQGKKGADGTITRSIILDKFKVFDGTDFNGRGKRQVIMRRVNANNGAFKITIK